MKKALILAVAFVITMSATAYAALNLFPDVVQNTWYTESIEDVYQKGLMNGYEDGNFGPNEMMTRGQLAVVLSRYDEHMHNTLQTQYGLSFVCPYEAIVDCPYGRELGAACMNPVYVDWALDNCTVPGFVGQQYDIFDTGAFSFDYPAEWTVDVDLNPVNPVDQFVEFFDENGYLVAELRCPIAEVGYEAWSLEIETNVLDATHEVNFWKATPYPGEEYAAFGNFALILMGDDDVWTNTCQLGSMGAILGSGEVDFDIFEEISDSVRLS